MTDLFTKYAISVPLVVTDAKDVAKKVVECWVLHIVVPDELHTDQGKNFGSDWLKNSVNCLKWTKQELLRITLREMVKWNDITV